MSRNRQVCDRWGGGGIGREREPPFVHVFCILFFSFAASCSDLPLHTWCDGAAAGLDLLRRTVMGRSSAESLDLHSCRFGPRTARVLVELLPPLNLTSLDLSFNFFRDEGSIVLLGLVRQCPTLTRLALTCNSMKDRGFVELASLLSTNRTVRVVRFFRWPMCSPCISRLAQSCINARSDYFASL